MIYSTFYTASKLVKKFTTSVYSTFKIKHFTLTLFERLTMFFAVNLFAILADSSHTYTVVH